MKVFDNGVIFINSAVEALTAMFSVLMLKRGLQSKSVTSKSIIVSLTLSFNNIIVVIVKGVSSVLKHFVTFIHAAGSTFID